MATTVSSDQIIKTISVLVGIVVAILSAALGTVHYTNTQVAQAKQELVAMLDDHASRPHVGAVTREEFNQYKDNTGLRLGKIEEKLDKILEAVATVKALQRTSSRHSQHK